MNIVFYEWIWIKFEKHCITTFGPAINLAAYSIIDINLLLIGNFIKFILSNKFHLFKFILYVPTFLIAFQLDSHVMAHVENDSICMNIWANGLHALVRR